MTDVNEDLLGWYHIDEMWNLYINGELRKAHISYICVDETSNDDDLYHVDHYDHEGEFLTSLRLDGDDIEPELRDREPTDRPWHL